MELSTIHNNLNPSLAAPAEAPAVPRIAPGDRALIQAIRAVNSAELLGYDNELSFVFDRHSGQPVVRIVNRETREVVQQIPAEYVLRMAEELNRG
jgi:hemin uptake protein HemP